MTLTSVSSRIVRCGQGGLPHLARQREAEPVDLTVRVERLLVGRRRPPPLWRSRKWPCPGATSARSLTSPPATPASPAKRPPRCHPAYQVQQLRPIRPRRCRYICRHRVRFAAIRTMFTTLSPLREYHSCALISTVRAMGGYCRLLSQKPRHERPQIPVGKR